MWTLWQLFTNARETSAEMARMRQPCIQRAVGTGTGTAQTAATATETTTGMTGAALPLQPVEAMHGTAWHALLSAEGYDLDPATTDGNRLASVMYAHSCIRCSSMLPSRKQIHSGSSSTFHTCCNLSLCL